MAVSRWGQTLLRRNRAGSTQLVELRLVSYLFSSGDPLKFQGVVGRFAIFSAPLGQNFGRKPPFVAQNCPPGAEVTPGRGRSLLLDLSLAQYGGTHDQKAQTPGTPMHLLPEALPAPSKKGGDKEKKPSCRISHEGVPLPARAGFHSRFHASLASVYRN